MAATDAAPNRFQETTMTSQTPNIVTEARRIAGLTVDAAEAEYRELRDQLRGDYERAAGPRARRSLAAQVARQRAAGGRHAATADRIEAEGEEAARSYDEGARVKTLLAIRTGRYDDAIRRGEPPYSASGPGTEGVTEAVELVVAARRADLTCSEPGCGRDVYARGLCDPHYLQAYRAEQRGEVPALKPIRDASEPARVVLSLRVSPGAKVAASADPDGARAALEAWAAGRA